MTFRRIVKRVATAVAAAIMLFVMCSCSSGPFAGRGVTVNVVNEVPDRLKKLSVSFCLEESGTKVFSNICADMFLEAKTYSFTLRKKDVENDEDLKTMSVNFTVSEENGEDLNFATFPKPWQIDWNIDVATFPLPSEYGDSYTFILRFENGEYVVTEG